MYTLFLRVPLWSGVCNPPRCDDERASGEDCILALHLQRHGGRRKRLPCYCWRWSKLRVVLQGRLKAFLCVFGYLESGTLERGCGGQAPLLPFIKGIRGSEVPFRNCFYSILATVFQPENTTEGTFMFKIDRNSPNRFTPLLIPCIAYILYW